MQKRIESLAYHHCVQSNQHTESADRRSHFLAPYFKHSEKFLHIVCLYFLKSKIPDSLMSLIASAKHHANPSGMPVYSRQSHRPKASKAIF
jgi:hypothetical protein